MAGFTDPLVDCRHCKNRFRADDPRIKGTPGQPDAQCPVCGSRGTLTEPRHVQPDVQDLHGAGGGVGRGGLPAPRDGAGHLRQLPQRAAVARGSGFPSASPRSARRSATRSRRGTSSSAPASSSRWRCSSSCSRAPTPSGSSAGASGGWSGTRSLGSHPAQAALASARGRASWPTTPARRSTSSTSFPSAGRRSRASTTAATSTWAGIRSTPARSWSTSTRRPTSAISPTSWRPRPAPTG